MLITWLIWWVNKKRKQRILAYQAAQREMQREAIQMQQRHAFQMQQHIMANVPTFPNNNQPQQQIVTGVPVDGPTVNQRRIVPFPAPPTVLPSTTPRHPHYKACKVGMTVFLRKTKVEEKFGQQNFRVFSEMRGGILVYRP